MTGQQKLLSFWVWLLLVAALCPGPQYVYSKPGGFRGRGKADGEKADGSKAPSSRGRGLSKQGLKWAGAAAAGVLGGTGTGYGLGFLGKPKHGLGGHRGHQAASSERNQQLHHSERQGFYNQSLWRALISAAAPTPTNNAFLTLGPVASLFVAIWIRVM